MWGFPRVVNSEEAVPSILQLAISMRHVETRLELRTEACLVDRCRFAMIATVLTRGDQPASWMFSACGRLPKTRIDCGCVSMKVGVGVDFHLMARAEVELGP